MRQTDGFYSLKVEKIILKAGQSDKPREDDLSSLSISIDKNYL